MKKDVSASFKQSTLLSWIELREARGSRACYESHSHHEFSFGMVTEGRAKYHNRQHTYQIGKGDIVTINPNEVHSCNPESGLWSYSMLFANAREMGEAQRDVLQCAIGSHLPFDNDLERNTQIQATFKALLAAVRNEYDVLHAQVCLYEFIESCWLDKMPHYDEVSVPEPTLNRIKEKLFDEISDAHQLETLASEAGMSRYQLLRAFKKQYGLPPHAYLIDEKIKRSKTMLKSGQAISDIALQLGFSDQAHFQRQFKKKLAVTPKYYQSHFVEK